MMWNNKSFGESCTFDCKKPFSLAICEECRGKTFDLALVSLNLVPFTKVFFMQCFIWPHGENQANICFAFP